MPDEMVCLPKRRYGVKCFICKELRNCKFKQVISVMIPGGCISRDKKVTVYFCDTCKEAIDA